MAKRDGDAKLLDALAAARHAGPAAAASVVKKGLKAASEVVIGRAAEVAAELELEAVADELAAAAADWLQRGEATTVLALLRACRRAGVRDRELWHAALRFEAFESDPVSRRRFDVGAAVRAEACRAVAECGDPAAAVLLAGVLFERYGPEVADNPAARAAAAQAIGHVGDAAAAEVLRIKLTRSQRDEPAVLGECVGSYCRLDPLDFDKFLATYLRTRPDVAEAAAVPLGEVRAARAVGPLLLCHDMLRSIDREEVAFVGLALVRQPEATERLLDRFRDARGPTALEAATALHLLARDPDVSAAVAPIAAARPDGDALRKAFEHGVGVEVERFV